MSDFTNLYGLNLTPDQQDLLLAALSSNNPLPKSNPSGTQVKSETESTPRHTSSGNFSVSPTSMYDASQLAHGRFSLDDESPFIDFHPELEFDFQSADGLIGDLPDGMGPTDDNEHGEKRKDMADDGDEESGSKRQDSDEKIAKKPGRKPLTSEPTTKRKAQNRAAQRAFRERKEKHLKDLETKVEELQRNSETANQENGLLRAQIERLQVELREYRKRLSWLTSGNGYSPMAAIPSAQSLGNQGLQNADFLFDFPKFGDLPGGHFFTNKTNGSTNQAKQPNAMHSKDAPGVLSRENLSRVSSHRPSASLPNSSAAAMGVRASPSEGRSTTRIGAASGFAATATPAQSNGGHFATSQDASTNSDSPSSSSDSHRSHTISSNGTSPEPISQSPLVTKPSDTHSHGGSTDRGVSFEGEATFCEKLGMACGNINNPMPALPVKTPATTTTTNTQAVDPQGSITDGVLDLDWLAQQNGGQFDPVLFGEWREPQQAILSQDFGTFFNEAFPLPDLGSPLHNITEATKPAAAKKNLIAEIDRKLENDDDEVVPGEDKSQMLSCNKIWDRLQSMEKFRNGEIDVDSLCSELRTKARCSGSGVVVDEKDVDDIMGRAR